MAAVTLWRCRSTALLWAAVAMFGMLLWILVELATLQHYAWLQAVYVAFGLCELSLARALLGIAPLITPRWLAAHD